MVVWTDVFFFFSNIARHSYQIKKVSDGMIRHRDLTNMEALVSCETVHDIDSCGDPISLKFQDSSQSHMSCVKCQAKLCVFLRAKQTLMMHPW